MFATVMSKFNLSIECSDHSSSFIMYDDADKPIIDEVVGRSDQLIYKNIPESIRTLSLNISDISKIIWGKGPGSFTGIRLCATWVQSLSYIHGIEVLPICSLTNRAFVHAKENNIKNDYLFGFLSANRLYAYKGIWKINDIGNISIFEPIALINKQELDARYVDLQACNAKASDAYEQSKVSPHSEKIVTDPFSIRPNYLFDQFS